MKVLHIGNIANNAYNNAKFLRRRGIEASVLVYDYTHVMGQPEWEDAVFDAPVDEYHPRWDEVNLNGFSRPAWFHQITLKEPRQSRRQRFRGEFRLISYWERLRRLRRAYHLNRQVRQHLSPAATQVARRARLFDVLRLIHTADRFRELFEGYDILQAYALDPVHTMLFSPGIPYVAFEHGTMRDLPFESSSYGRLLGLAYHRAARVIITNPDVVRSARRLGLSNYLFIPHPIDEEKYRPAPSPLRRAFEERHQCDLILFAPSRHNWALKGNDKMVRAVARLGAATRQRLLLILCDWGQEMARTRQLLDELKLTPQVLWVPPLNKRLMIDYYNAADIVLDQFAIGTFGTVTPEAMACEKPVLLHFDRAVHEWCYEEMPPVVSAHSEEEIFSALVDLAGDAKARADLGRRSRAWIERYHGWRLVADRQIAIYREILER